MMKVQIRQPSPSYAEILLNGVPIEDSIKGATVTMRAGQLPKVELDPVVEDISLDLENAQVYVSAAARHLLITMGWSPPEVDHVEVLGDDQDREEEGSARSDP